MSTHKAYHLVVKANIMPPDSQSLYADHNSVLCEASKSFRPVAKEAEATKTQGIAFTCLDTLTLTSAYIIFQYIIYEVAWTVFRWLLE